MNIQHKKISHAVHSITNILQKILKAFDDMDFVRNMNLIEMTHPEVLIWIFENQDLLLPSLLASPVMPDAVSEEFDCRQGICDQAEFLILKALSNGKYYIINKCWLLKKENEKTALYLGPSNESQDLLFGFIYELNPIILEKILSDPQGIYSQEINDFPFTFQRRRELNLRPYRDNSFTINRFGRKIALDQDISLQDKRTDIIARNLMLAYILCYVEIHNMIHLDTSCLQGDASNRPGINPSSSAANGG